MILTGDHEVKMRRICRIWWPKQLSSTEPSSSCNLLFGWFVSSSSASLDIVVAFSCNQASASSLQSGLAELLHRANGIMNQSLQDKSMFSLLGQCTAYLRNGQLSWIGMEEDETNNYSAHDITSGGRSHEIHQLHGLLEQYRQASSGCANWIELLYDSHDLCDKEIHWMPKLHRVYWNGQIMSQCDVHVIFYESPAYAVHHFSLGSQHSFEQIKTPLKKPKWFDELKQKQPLNDLDTVILAINSATAAKTFFERNEVSKKSHAKTFITWVFLNVMWQLLAIFLASLSTLFYIFLQLFYSLLRFRLVICAYNALRKALSNTWIHIRIHCCQILYWPIFLLENDLRSQSCVEHAEKAALHKHSMWSSLVVDILLGALLGLALLFHVDSICLWVSNFASDFTNELLRSGCVWLMGVPAGFKLNTELAEVLGMVSLNAIQIWSALWILLGSLFVYFIKGLAILAILFGATVPAALVIDMITTATLHMSCLHWLISILYSQQLHALAALWRLFRGRKWNPLRKRFDSYEYSVKQHVVGSLLFAPLLLLLPTTSLFYVFFTMMNSAISLVCMSIEVVISLIHATPYFKIFLCLTRRRRFPSGVWFKIISCMNNSIDQHEFAAANDSSVQSDDLQQKEYTCEKLSTTLTSVLHSNFLSIGQIILPHYRKVFSRVSGSHFAKSAYGILSGKRIASNLGLTLPSTMPWIFMPWKEYWCLCRNSILACMEDLTGDCNVYG